MRHSVLQPITFAKCAEVLLISLISSALMNCEGKIMLTFIEDGRDQLTADFSGSEVHPMDEEEGQRFGLLPTAACLQKAGSYMGKNPDYCYFSGKYHTDFFWPEVQSVYVVQEVKLVDFNATEDTVSREHFFNPLYANVGIKIASTAKITDSIQYETDASGKFKLSGSVSVNYQAFSVKTSTSMEHTWGRKEATKHEKTEIIKAFMETSLGPHSNATGVFSGLKKTALYDVTYRNYLAGCVIIDYSDVYKDHHFHCLYTSVILPGGFHVRTYTERVRIHYKTADRITLTREVGERPRTN